jgi:eukaryotic-like serine/threonine-protein kinase
VSENLKHKKELLNFRLPLFSLMRIKNQLTDLEDSFYEIRIFVIIFHGLSLLLLAVVITGIAEQEALAQTTTSAPTNFLTYENSTYAIKFEFPSDWEKTETLSGRVTNIEFISPLKEPFDLFPATISIAIEKNLVNITTPEQYARLSDGLLNQMLSGFNTTIESQPSSIGSVGGPLSYERVLTIDQPVAGLALKVAQVFTTQNNKAYIITYTAEPANFLDHLPTLQRMVNSFQIIG